MGEIPVYQILLTVKGLLSLINHPDFTEFDKE